MQMFLGWEGIGLSSYLLINFWFTRLQANKAAIKAMIINRIGDFGLALGIFMIYIFSLWNILVFLLWFLFFAEQQVCFLSLNFNLLNVVGVLLFIGAVGKSAQLGLRGYLMLWKVQLQFQH